MKKPIYQWLWLTQWQKTNWLDGNKRYKSYHDESNFNATIKEISSYDVTEFNDIYKWCEENCKGLIYFNHLSYSFKFELEVDAMAFRLRWDE